MIFFTTYVTIIRHNHESGEKRRGTPARVEGNTIWLPVGAGVHAGDHLQYRLVDDEIRTMVVIDVVPPHLNGAGEADDHIEVACVPAERAATPQSGVPALHPAMSVAVKLLEDGQLSQAITEAFQLVEARVRALTASEYAGHALMESVFGTRPPHLDITTATGQAATDEREGFRLLFIGAMLGLRAPHEAAGGMTATLEEVVEYLAVASMLMRRLDLAAIRLG
jgi:uncharacterized protein (TIGR02391 family)